ATEALARIPPDKGDVSMLCRVCGDAKEPMGIRVQGVQALGRLGPEGKSGLPTLVGLLKQPDGSLRRLALEALAAIGPDAKAAAPELVALLKSNDKSLRIQVLQALETIASDLKDSKESLVEVMKGTDKEVGMIAARTLIQTGNAKYTVGFLIGALKAKSEPME